MLFHLIQEVQESNSSNQGFNLKRWTVSAREMRQPLIFLLDCLFISSLWFSFIFYKSIRSEVWYIQFPMTQFCCLHKSLLLSKQSSCFSDSLRISLIIYYLPLLMYRIVNLWLHCNSCYIPQFTTYLPKSCLPLTSWAHYLLKRLLAIVSLKIPNFYQFSSVTQSCPSLCDPMNHSTPGLPVHHQLLEFTRVSDAIQPSHPLSSSSPPAPNPSQHQGLFQWVNSSHEVAKVLEFQL